METTRKPRFSSSRTHHTPRFCQVAGGCGTSMHVQHKPGRTCHRSRKFRLSLAYVCICRCICTCIIYIYICLHTYVGATVVAGCEIIEFVPEAAKSEPISPFIQAHHTESWHQISDLRILRFEGWPQTSISFT